MLKNIFARKKESEFLISCFDSDKDELAHCHIGDIVNLWYPDDKAFVNVYRTGTLGGQGRLSKITGRDLKKLINHFERGDQIHATIIKISKSSLLLQCQVTTNEQIVKEKGEKIESIKSVITKPYKPKSASYKLFTRSELNFKLNSILDYKESDLIINSNDDEKIEYHRIKLFYKDEHIGDISAQTIVQKLVRAYNSGYLPEISISTLQNDDKAQILLLKISFNEKPVTG